MIEDWKAKYHAAMKLASHHMEARVSEAFESGKLAAEIERLREMLLGRDKSVHDLLEDCHQLEQEIARLKRGEFTPEEFQNLCHESVSNPANYNNIGMDKFCDGCDEYQRKLFGTCRSDLLKASK
jgi:hypothetical protein